MALLWAAAADLASAQPEASAQTASQPAAATAPAVPATVEQPRAFGHTIGDVLTQRVLLQLDGHDFRPAKLPEPARIGVWFERHPARVETAADGPQWLVLQYQLLNAPRELATVNLPALKLAGPAGSPELQVPAWTISVAPLTPRRAFGEVGLPELQPDRPAPRVETGPLQRRLRFSVGALVLALTAWGAWLAWRNWRASSAQPFARALRQLRRLAPNDPRAWRALHEAFDHTAGRVLQGATLPMLFEQSPQLKPLRARIEQFYAQSAALFFGPGLPAGALSPQQLCGELRRIERRHER
jgi:mxaA protein